MAFKWTAKHVRGAAASKVINLGAETQSVLVRARWADYRTFLKYYFKRCVYSNTPADPKDRSVEALLRYPGNRV